MEGVSQVYGSNRVLTEVTSEITTKTEEWTQEV